MTMPKLSILICALDHRTSTVIPHLVRQQQKVNSQLSFPDLLYSNVTYPITNTLTALQKISNTFDVVKYSTTQVEILICSDNGVVPSGAKRQLLSDLSSGEYICCVDDDDEVYEDYISSILQAAASNADLITFNLTYFKDKRITEHWMFGLYRNLRPMGLMSANHLCVWKRSIARTVAWCPDLGYGDDRLWFEPLVKSGLVKSVYHINKSLYSYFYSSTESQNQSVEKRAKSKKYIGRGLRCFKQDGIIYIETGNQPVVPKPVGSVAYLSTSDPTPSTYEEPTVGYVPHVASPSCIQVRDKNNVIDWINPLQFEHFHTVRF